MSGLTWLTSAALAALLVGNVVVQSPWWVKDKAIERLSYDEPQYPAVPRGWTVDRASAAILQVSACLACASCAISAYFIQQWLVVGLALSGTVTSFFYWREPIFHGLARKLDVIVILSGLNCHFYLIVVGEGSLAAVTVACVLYIGEYSTTPQKYI